MIDAAVRHALDLLGPPDLGVVLGSGFDALADALGCREGLDVAGLPGGPIAGTDGHCGRLEVAERGGRRVWVFRGRVHLHEGYAAGEAAFAVTMLAAAGGRGVLLTCAAGGLADRAQPGDLVMVHDHLNLTGDDPVRSIPPAARTTPFPDLQQLYDGAWADRIRAAAEESGVPLGEGVLAAVRGPCYETAAEVRMLRAFGADLVSMSIVPEAIAAGYHGLRVAAIACVSNRGAGLGRGGAIDHGDVLAHVRHTVSRRARFLAAAVDAGLLSG